MSNNQLDSPLLNPVSVRNSSEFLDDPYSPVLIQIFFHFYISLAYSGSILEGVGSDDRFEMAPLHKALCEQGQGSSCI